MVNQVQKYGDRLIITDGISGNDLLHARLEENEAYENYKKIEASAKLWQKNLKDINQT